MPTKASGVISNLIMGSVGLLSKGFLKYCVATQIHNFPTLVNLIHQRPPNTPLLTVSNHTSTLDDPVIFGILPLNTLFNAAKMRWTLGANELLFTNPIFSAFFSRGRVLAISRGDGVMQPNVTRAIQLMNKGEWIHIFPEGKIVPNSNSLQGRLKWGVGRLIMESVKAPILLPIIHQGFETIKPLNSWFPCMKRSLVITIGQPIDTGKLRDQLLASNLSIDDQRSQVTAFVSKEMSKYYKVDWPQSNQPSCPLNSNKFHQYQGKD